MDFLKNLKLKNLFQPSTLKAIMYVLSAVGLTVDIQILNAISVIVLGITGSYDALRDDKAPKKNGIGKSSTAMIVLLITGMVFMSCAAITTSRVCTNIPEGEYSVICQMAEKAGTTPENVANIIKIADLLLLEETHTAEQAWTFLHEIKDASATAQVLDGATWDQFIGYVSVKFMQLPPKVRAALEIVKTLQGVDMSDVPVKVLSGYDWGMVDAAIDDHIDTIAPFVPFDDVRFVPFDEVRMLGNLNLAP